MKRVPKLYIQVTKPGKRFSAICANKVRRLKEYLPSEEILSTYLSIQKLKLEKDVNYKPKALSLQIERSIFNDIIFELRAKDKDVSIDNIPLMFQVPSIPVCIIFPKEDEE